MRRNVVTAQGLGKCYRAYASPTNRLMAALGLPASATESWALKDVNLEIPQGSCLGVIGDNGAGKSTLLKLLAGALSPSHGALHISGRVTAILELGAGFHPEFSGRENVRFGGQLMGYTVEELSALEPSIAEFSELGAALDRPLKTYSSGMVVRLAFALVTAKQPELLIVDEALAVGDQHFQKKCINRIEQFRTNGCTVLFCSHSMYHVRQLCDTALWLRKGQAVVQGPTESVLMRYETHLRELEGGHQRSTPKTEAPLVQGGDGQLPAQAPASSTARLVSATVHDLDSHEALSGARPLVGPDLTITLEATGQGDDVPSFGVMLEQVAGVGVTSVATHAEGAQPTRYVNREGVPVWRVTLTFTSLPLHSGEYVLSYYLFDSKGLVVFEEWLKHTTFSWLSPSLTPGLVRLPHFWS